MGKITSQEDGYVVKLQLKVEDCSDTAEAMTTEDCLDTPDQRKVEGCSDTAEAKTETGSEDPLSTKATLVRFQFQTRMLQICFNEILMKLVF